MEVPGLSRDDHNVAHVARHAVTAAEVEEVIDNPSTRWNRVDTHQPGRLQAGGLTAAGRYLIVILDTPTRQNTAYVVTARPMTNRERSNFEEGAR